MDFLFFQSLAKEFLSDLLGQQIAFINDIRIIGSGESFDRWHDVSVATQHVYRQLIHALMVWL
jgi:hypothetical protein